MRFRSSLVPLLLPLLVATAAHAQDEQTNEPIPRGAPSADPVPAPSPPPPVVVEPAPSDAAPSLPEARSESGHTRSGVSFSGVYARSFSTAYYARATAASPGLVLDLGLQITERAAFYVRAEAASLLLTNQAAAYAVFEWTPQRWVSLGTGAGYDGNATFGTNTWSGPSIPLIVGFNFLGAGAKSGMRLGLEAAGGPGTLAGVAQNVFGWHTAISYGGVWM